MSDKKLRFGILGCGMIADFHADAINSLDNAVLIGVADSNPERAQAFADKRGIKAFGSFEAMLESSDIDAVCICTPSGFHAEGAIAALKAKKHVVLEKPMAINTKDAKRICKMCEKSGCVLTVICQLRFSEDIKRLKQLVSENAFGKNVFCDLYMKYWRSEEYYANGGWKGTKKIDGGGALMNQGIHGVDALLYIAGDAKLLKAKTKTNFHKIEVEDTAVAMLDFANGACGVIEASTCAYPGFERRIEVMGSNGYAILRESKLEKLVIGDETLIDSTTEAVSGTASDPSAMSYQLHAMQIDNFIKAINGEEKLLIDHNEGLKAVDLIEKIYRQ